MAKLSTELQRYFLDSVDPATVTDQGTAAEAAAVSKAPLDKVTPPDKVTLDEILTLAGERTFGFLFVLLSLPSALPLPAPGYSVPFGLVMALLALQLIQGAKQPWLPKGWRKQGFDRKKVQGVVKAGLPWLRRIESISRPRLTAVCTSLPGRLVIGVAIALMSVCMMIPIPGTNTLPAMGIFVTGFGLLDDDGAISLAGLSLCVVALGLVTAILTLGVGVVDWIKNTVLDLVFNRSAAP